MNDPDFSKSMSLLRIVPDGDGPALFEEVDIPFLHVHAHGAETEAFPAREISFVWTPDDFSLDFHAASRRRIIVVLDGQMEIEDGRGDCRLFGAGDMIDVLDTTGMGHKTHVVGGRKMHTALIEIGDQIHPDWPLLDGPDYRTDTVTRTTTGPDGRSRFVDDILSYCYKAPLGDATASVPLSGYQFAFRPGTLDQGFHNAPQNQFVFNLMSGMQVETGDGATRKIHPGDIFRGSDTTGQGHKTSALEGAQRISIFAHVTSRG